MEPPLDWKLLEVWQKCHELEIEPPKEVDDFFYEIGYEPEEDLEDFDINREVSVPVQIDGAIERDHPDL